MSQLLVFMAAAVKRFSADLDQVTLTQGVVTLSNNMKHTTRLFLHSFTYKVTAVGLCRNAV